MILIVLRGVVLGRSLCAYFWVDYFVVYCFVGLVLVCEYMLFGWVNLVGKLVGLLLRCCSGYGFVWFVAVALCKGYLLLVCLLLSVLVGWCPWGFPVL